MGTQGTDVDEVIELDSESDGEGEGGGGGEVIESYYGAATILHSVPDTSYEYGAATILHSVPDTSYEAWQRNGIILILQVILYTASRSFPFLLDDGMSGDQYAVLPVFLLASALYAYTGDYMPAQHRIIDGEGEAARPAVPSGGVALQWAGYAWDLTVMPMLVYACVAAPQAKDGAVPDDWQGSGMWTFFAAMFVAQALATNLYQHPWRHQKLGIFFEFYGELIANFSAQSKQWLAMIAMLAWRLVGTGMAAFMVAQTVLAAFVSHGRTLYAPCLGDGDHVESVDDLTAVFVLVACAVSHVKHVDQLQGARHDDRLSRADIPLGFHGVMVLDCGLQGYGHYLLIRMTMAVWTRHLSCEESLRLSEAPIGAGGKVAAILLVLGEALAYHTMDWCHDKRLPMLVVGPGERKWTPRRLWNLCKGQAYQPMPPTSPL